MNMRENNGTIYNWLVYNKLRRVIKKHGLNQHCFEALCLIKVIEKRGERKALLKDIKHLVTNCQRRDLPVMNRLASLGLIDISRSIGRWRGRSRYELSVTPSGNELLYKIRQASESAIACLKHQLDDENSGLNNTKKVKKV